MALGLEVDELAGRCSGPHFPLAGGLEVDELAGRLQVDELTQRLEVDELTQRLEVDELTQRLEVDEHLEVLLAVDDFGLVPSLNCDEQLRHHQHRLEDGATRSLEEKSWILLFLRNFSLDLMLIQFCWFVSYQVPKVSQFKLINMNRMKINIGERTFIFI